MAVASVKPIAGGQTGSETSEDGIVTKSYSVVYRVVVDDPQDGQAVVLAAGGLPKTYVDTYAFGNESDGSALCKSRSPSRERSKETHLRWLVTCNFDNKLPKNQNSDEERDVNGDPVTDPADAYKVIEVEKVTRSRIVSDAKYFGVFDKDRVFVAKNPPGLVLGTKHVITNSAGVPRAVDDDEVLWLYRITKNINNWDGTLKAFANTVNTDVITLQNSDAAGVKFTETFNPLKLLMLGVRPRERRKKGLLWFRVTFEVLFNPKGWRHLELDQGFAVFEEEGDGDGHSGTLSSNDVAVPARSRIRTISDRFGRTPKRPRLLDGEGKLLDPPDGKGYFLQWAIKDEIPWGPLNL